MDDEDEIGRNSDSEGNESDVLITSFIIRGRGRGRGSRGGKTGEIIRGRGFRGGRGSRGGRGGRGKVVVVEIFISFIMDVFGF